MEIPEVVAQQPEWRATLRLCVYGSTNTAVGKRLQTLPSHPTLGERRALAEERKHKQTSDKQGDHKQTNKQCKSRPSSQSCIRQYRSSPRNCKLNQR